MPAPRRSSSAYARDSEQGFILITAVMFVLILTLLGASLMKYGPMENSLSTDRIGNTQAFYYAESGLGRAEFVLLSGAQNLSSVNSPRPVSCDNEHVWLIRAIQQHPFSGGSDSTGAFFSTGPDAGPITLVATGRGRTAMGGYEYRTLTLKFTVGNALVTNYGNLAASMGGGVNWSSSPALSGRIRVPTAADSMALAARGFPPDSISVGAVLQPDIASYISSMTDGPGGYSALTSAQLSAPAESLGLNPNGIYYAASGINLPGGPSTTITIFGKVFLLVHGQFSTGRNINIVAGNLSAELILVADNPGAVGLDFSGTPSDALVPLMLLTNGDVNFGAGANLAAVAMFGRNFSLGSGQSMTYNHSIMDPMIIQLINQRLLPTPGDGSGVVLTAAPSPWAELAPRLN